MALIVAVILCVSAVILGFAGADEVHGSPFGGLQFLPELGAPADDLGYAVPKGHVAESSVGGLRG